MPILRKVLSGILICLSLPVFAAEPDWSRYDGLLAAFIEPGQIEGISVNRLDYQGIGQDPRFQALVAEIRAFDVRTLASREERLAFYINAYNLLTIQLILDEWPVDSIRDIGNIFRGPWDRTMLRNADGDLSLDDIEHRIIRPLGEPRIHFAVNCASVSCPDLRGELYTAGMLDAQLDEQTRIFLSQPGKGLVVDKGIARVSRIFRWYGDDFDDLPGFIRRYVTDASFVKVSADLPYNWNLNSR
ncbi:MAG: DUF547 domain-containing protein [Pseudomonadota bacterium]